MLSLLGFGAQEIITLEKETTYFPELNSEPIRILIQDRSEKPIVQDRSEKPAFSILEPFLRVIFEVKRC